MKSIDRSTLVLFTALLLLFAAGCESRSGSSTSTGGDPKGTTSSGAAQASGSASPSAGPEEARLRYSRALVGRFGARLQAALMTSLSSGGPISAIKVCNTEAPEIARGLEIDEGWSIRRTSLGLRNPDNAPDAWERATLEAFEKDRAAGKNPAELETHAVIEDGGKRAFRYMKAIPTAALCLDCHGGNIAADVTAQLDGFYPEDRARGFNEGDIRGAFSIRKEL